MDRDNRETLSKKQTELESETKISRDRENMLKTEVTDWKNNANVWVSTTYPAFFAEFQASIRCSLTLAFHATIVGATCIAQRWNL